MALKNIKNHGCGSVTRNNGILAIDQLQIVTRVAVPTDADLANGRIVYVTGTGFRAYAEGAWFTIPTSTTGGSAGSWDTLYTSDKTLTIDSTTMTFAGIHATNDVFTITGSGSGDLLQFTNTGTGSDVKGTSNTWSVSAAGAAVFTAVTGCDTLTAAGNLAIDATGAGTIILGATSTGAITLTRAVTATASLTITGSADTTCLTVTAGDVTVTAGLLTLDDDDTATGNLSIPSSTATSGNVISVVANALTSGAALKLSSTNGAGFSGNGGFVHISDGTNPVFTVQRYGATTIAGNAATNVLTLTAGNEVITAGNLTLTSGNFVMTSGSFTYTLGDMAMSDGSLTITDADNAATLSITNDTATTASVFVFVGSGAFTGSTTTSFATLTASGLTTGTALYVPVAAVTTGKAIHITAGATQTSGSLLYVQDTGANCAITSGTAATFDLTATAITGTVNKIGNGVTISSSRTTTTGTVADDWDLASIIRTDIINGAGSMSATGSVLYVENAVTNTSGTVTDTTKGIEVVMDSLGTGDGIEITHAATGGKALDIVSAATTVSDVLITASGVKASGKACLQVVSTGSTAAGGALLNVAHGGTGDPAAPTSYIASFSQASATCANNPVAVIINAGASTAAGLQVTGSGASAGGLLELNSTATGALGAVLKFDQAANSAAVSDVIGRLLFTALDAGNAAEEYGRIDCIIRDTTNASEDADFIFYADRAGTLTQQLWLDSDVNGIIVGDGANNAYISSSGAYDLILETNSGSSSGTITIVDAANGDITVAPNGTGQSIFYAPTWIVTNKAAAATLTVAEGGVITADTTTGAFSLILPAAATSAGLWYTIVKTDANANAVTLDANGAELINGSATYASIDAQYDTATIVCNGTAWYIVAKIIA